MTIIILFVAILFLLVLIGWCKINPFVSLLLASLLVGLANGMPPDKLIGSINSGIGTTLGPLVLTLVFGMVLGTILSETGAVQQISSRLLKIFGDRYINLAMVITGFSVGIAMFYNAGFMVLIPLVFAVAAKSGKPLVVIGIAIASALSVTHCFLPPHPGPTALTVIFKADIGKTLLYGIVVGIPALIAGGLVFPGFVKKVKPVGPQKFFAVQTYEENKLPGFGACLFIAMVPVLLMGVYAMSEILMMGGTRAGAVLKFLGDPGISLMIASLLAIIILGKKSGVDFNTLMNRSFDAVSSVTMILLIIAAGGAFKQVLIESGTGSYIAEYFKGSSIPPLFLAWLIAAFIRIAIGSATVAGLTAAGIMQPLVSSMQVSPELMVIAIGAGSVMCSHVNDTGFWMFKEYFGLSLKDTFRTWTMMESIIGIVGLAGVLLLNLVVH
ncbi:MAG: gluconate permease [Ferruginibacter sp.]|nr:gluconate permease [Ferruginibacter sp.]